MPYRLLEVTLASLQDQQAFQYLWYNSLILVAVWVRRMYAGFVEKRTHYSVYHISVKNLYF